MPSTHDIKAKANGLYNNVNDYTAPEGALSTGDNVFHIKDDEHGVRRGFDNLSN